MLSLLLGKTMFPASASTLEAISLLLKICVGTLRIASLEVQVTQRGSWGRLEFLSV